MRSGLGIIVRQIWSEFGFSYLQVRSGFGITVVKYGVIYLYVFACILKLFCAIFEMRVVTVLVPGRNLQQAGQRSTTIRNNGQLYCKCDSNDLLGDQRETFLDLPLPPLSQAPPPLPPHPQPPSACGQKNFRIVITVRRIGGQKKSWHKPPQAGHNNTQQLGRGFVDRSLFNNIDLAHCHRKKHFRLRKASEKYFLKFFLIITHNWITDWI